MERATIYCFRAALSFLPLGFGTSFCFVELGLGILILTDFGYILEIFGFGLWGGSSGWDLILALISFLSVIPGVIPLGDEAYGTTSRSLSLFLIKKSFYSAFSRDSFLLFSYSAVPTCLERWICPFSV